MPLRRLKRKYIRAKDVFNTAGNYQIKVGGTRYKQLVAQRNSAERYSGLPF